MDAEAKSEAIRQLQSLRYHADFALHYLSGNYGFRACNMRDDGDHPGALFCIGPYAVYDRFKGKSPRKIKSNGLIVTL